MGECFFNSIGPDLQKKRDAIAKVLEDIGLNPVVPEGGYFIMADWSKFADKVDLSGEPDEQADYRFVKWLCKNKKLLGIPPSAFSAARTNTLERATSDSASSRTMKV